MSFFKWLGGGLGWALGGPIGGIVGFVVGSLFDGTKSVNAGRPATTARSTGEGDFKVSLIVLIACVMKADGEIKKTELNVVKQFFIVNFGEQGALQALQFLKTVLSQNIDVQDVAAQAGQYLNYSAKLQMLHFLFEVAVSDGVINAAELAVITRISNVFGISSVDFESLKAPHFKQNDPLWAYKTLETDPTASDEDVKKAYRRMAMKFHPDKVNMLGEEIKKSATEKFRAINDAYEQIKRLRGMN
jgi:DnaJ like chaperone protein